MIKKFAFWVVDSWRAVMDNRYNPLRFITDKPFQTYITLVLFVMWSAFFGLVAIYYIGWIEYSIVTSIAIHLSILVPIIFTNIAFYQAENTNAKWYVEFRQKQWMRKLPDVKKRILWDLDKEA